LKVLTSFLDRRLGTSNEPSAFNNLGPGTTAQENQSDNKEYITFSQSEAAATSVTASSDASTVSATSAATKTGSVTFVVDFSTGAISMAQTEQTSVATQVQISSPRSTFSTLA
jgi:glucan biosynthesis protein